MDELLLTTEDGEQEFRHWQGKAMWQPYQVILRLGVLAIGLLLVGAGLFYVWSLPSAESAGIRGSVGDQPAVVKNPSPTTEVARERPATTEAARDRPSRPEPRGKEARGTVRAVDATAGTLTLAVRQQEGRTREASYRLAPDIRVRNGSDEVGLSKVAPGARVRLTLGDDDTVVEMRLEKRDR